MFDLVTVWCLGLVLRVCGFFAGAFGLVSLSGVAWFVLVFIVLLQFCGCVCLEICLRVYCAICCGLDFGVLAVLGAYLFCWWVICFWCWLLSLVVCGVLAWRFWAWWV